MGKWTLDYTDDVLHSKIKIMVSGAIKRSALEETEPTIKYEEFVQDLDTGDSFTTSIIEILVKELAERRTRPNAYDRRFIADRSAKSLRQLATAPRIYRNQPLGRYHHSRRSNLSEYLSVPPIEMDMEEDEDIFERMLDSGATIEGARLNSDLYEAYGANPGPSPRPLSSPSPPSDDTASPIVAVPPSSFSSGPWSLTGPLPTTMLTRQPSIRRPIRSRTVDFNDFTYRRRLSTRDNQNSRAESSEQPEMRDPSVHPARRFFPFRTRRHEHVDSWNSDMPSPPPHEVEDSRTRSPEPPHAPWFNLTPSFHREPAGIDEVLAVAEVSDERTHVSSAPRLRRGGIRAPESILSRHASPYPAIPSVLENTANSEPPSAATEAPGDGPLPVEPSGNYPTPGPTEHEFFA